MATRARNPALRLLLALAAIFIGGVLKAADPAISGPWDVLTLKDGRILHKARAMSDEGDSFIVTCDEGLFKIAKSSLPQAPGAPSSKPAASAAPEMVMQPFNPDSAPLTPEPPVKPKAKPAPTGARASAAKLAPNPVFEGCTLASFTLKAFQNSLGSAQVVIQNGTETPVVITPGDLVCVTLAGKRLAGRQLVADGFPPIIKRRQVVLPLSSVDVLVTFSNDSLDGSSVQWAK